MSKPFSFFSRGLGLAVLLLCGAARAMSYVPMSDASLTDSADAVVVGTIHAVDDTPQSAQDAADVTRYELAVERVLKGSGVPPQVKLRVPGSRDLSREGALIVPGAPHFGDGEQALVFLNLRADGSYAVAQLVLGAFHVRDGIAERDLGDATAVQAKALDAGAAPDETQQARDLEKFSSWIAAHSAGGAPDEDYWTAAPQTVSTKFVLASPPARWFEFDNGNSVTIYAGNAGQLNLTGGGYDDFQKAIAAWDNDSGSNIKYVYGGTAATGGGMDKADSLNEILFNDPLDDIAGIFNCSSGGVLAYGGYRSLGQGTFNNAVFGRIVEADVVVQDGAGCALQAKRNTSAQETFAHELGHTLGLQHSCGDNGQPACVSGTTADDALMRPDIHGDGRGAALETDDRNAVAYLYGAAAGTTPSSGSGNGNASGSVGAASSGGGAFGAMLGLPLMIGAWLRWRTAVRARGG